MEDYTTDMFKNAVNLPLRAQIQFLSDIKNDSRFRSVENASRELLEEQSKLISDLTKFCLDISKINAQNFAVALCLPNIMFFALCEGQITPEPQGLDKMIQITLGTLSPTRA